MMEPLDARRGRRTPRMDSSAAPDGLSNARLHGCESCPESAVQDSFPRTPFLDLGRSYLSVTCRLTGVEPAPEAVPETVPAASGVAPATGVGLVRSKARTVRLKGPSGTGARARTIVGGLSAPGWNDGRYFRVALSAVQGLTAGLQRKTSR